MSTLTPALKVRSTTWPVRTFFSLVRTKAPPLPGLTCWNSTTFHRTPSRSRVMPFFRSFVVAICASSSFASSLDRQRPAATGTDRPRRSLPAPRTLWVAVQCGTPPGLQDEQLAGRAGGDAGLAGGPFDDEDVLDADAAAPRQVDP